MNRDHFISRIKAVDSNGFEALALDIFHYQAANNPVFKRFLELLRKDPTNVRAIDQIPHLPIGLFKRYLLKAAEWEAQTVFTSSGTTGQIPSQHAVRDLPFYLANARRCFEEEYGEVENWCILALLPSYLERTGSSLVAMAQAFIQWSKHPESGFFLNDFEKLHRVIMIMQRRRAPILLIGVSFALLDFAEQYPGDYQGLVMMETGGMKGRRKELTREELHDTLKKAFNLTKIHSEYGMTELLSQAYSKGEGLFRPSPTMSVSAADPYDPLSLARPGRTGTLQIIDLANLDTCSFIATEDLGRVYDDGNFEVIGRLDRSELRGCNLMLE